MKKEKEKKGLAALDAYLDEKRQPRDTVKPKEVELKTEKEKKGLAALDAYLEQSNPLNQ